FYRGTVFEQGHPMNAVTIISSTANTASILLNGNSIASQFNAFPNNTAYRYAHILLDTMLQYHIISNEPVIVYQYSGIGQGSTAFPIGDVNPISFPDTTFLVSDTLEKCINDSIVLSGLPGYSYQWSTGATTENIKIADSGSYTVTMSAPGCSYAIIKDF